MNDNIAEPDQQVLFVIDGPDEDGCVWIGSREGDPYVWSQNLGPVIKVAEVLGQWLASFHDEKRL